MWNKDQVIRETRWSRTYANDSKTCLYVESKFLDGSVSITLEELTIDWPTWTTSERLDFCNAIHCAPPNNPADILRFLAKDQTENVRSTIASCIARHLPPEESMPILANWTTTAPPGQRSNYFQAISIIPRSQARDMLQSHLAELFSHPKLMDDVDWCNDIARDLLWCVKYLLELGSPANDLRTAYERLAQHPCDRIHDLVCHWLADSFE